MTAINPDEVTPEPGTVTEDPSSAPVYEMLPLGKDGKRRVKNPDGGFPIVMLADETPAQAVDRYRLKRAENMAAGKPKATAQSKGRSKPARNDGSRGTIADRLPPEPDAARADPPPRVQAQQTGPSAATIVQKVSDDQLKEAWEEILTLPGVFFGMPIHDPALDRHVPNDPADPAKGSRLQPGFRCRCAYCRDHFFTAGAPMADELLKMGNENEAVRRWLVRGYHLYAAISGGTIVAMYLGKPILHHLGPETATNQIAAMAGPFLSVKKPDGQILHADMPPRPHNPRLRRPGGPRKRRGRPGPRPPREPVSHDHDASTSSETGAAAQTI